MIEQLRIGNLVYLCDVGLHSEESIFIWSKNSYTQNMDYIKPIPLTQEWLEKFGFIGRKDFMWTDSMNGFGISIRDGKYYGHFKDLGNVLYRAVVEVTTVHQLMNLYFALTGTELTIKEL